MVQNTIILLLPFLLALLVLLVVLLLLLFSLIVVLVLLLLLITLIITAGGSWLSRPALPSGHAGAEAGQGEQLFPGWGQVGRQGAHHSFLITQGSPC